LSWNYPFTAATNRKAKSSVTALRREADERDNEAEQTFPPKNIPSRKMARGKLSASEIGAAHHKFLQHVALEKTGEIAAEANRLARENYLSADERAALDLDALAQFWNSNLGQKVSQFSGNVRRELPFTVRLSPVEIAEITGDEVPDGLENEFVVVQGVADLVVLQPAEIWLVDFKTDDFGPDGLAGKIKTYAPQLKLYAVALEKIFDRKVTLRALHFLALRRTEEV
jgi:ATP-dependent helicase/nuclease subunit A